MKINHYQSIEISKDHHLLLYNKISSLSELIFDEVIFENSNLVVNFILYNLAYITDIPYLELELSFSLKDNIIYVDNTVTGYPLEYISHDINVLENFVRIIFTQNCFKELIGKQLEIHKENPYISEGIESILNIVNNKKYNIKLDPKLIKIIHAARIEKLFE